VRLRHAFTPFPVKDSVISPAMLYNATTVASIDYQAHHANE
jgi:hypothetical protein